MQGANYGWPYVRGLNHGPYTAPVHVWSTTIAPSGLSFVTLPGSSWTGKALVAGLRGQVLRLLTFDGARVISDEPLLLNQFGRLRAVTEAPDGAIWVTTSNRDGRGTPVAGDDRILRIVPPASGAPAAPPALPLDTASPAPGDQALGHRPGAEAPVRDEPGRSPGRLAIRRLLAPAGVRRGSAARVAIRFTAVPAGRVALQTRLAGGWSTLRSPPPGRAA